MIDDILLEAEEKMERAVSVAKEDFMAIRTGRATPAMFNKISVDYYGTPTPIQQMASFQTPEARLIVISPFDKGQLHAIEKAIRDSDLGVNPGNDGTVIRVALPALTEERRKEYIKQARHQAEESRVAIRNTRRHIKDSLEKLSKDGHVSEDDVRRAEKALDDLTGKHIGVIDELLKHKEAELLEV